MGCAVFVQVTLGYMLMLAAMTYQVELLAFVLIGLGTGHHFLNVEGPVTERPDPCCAEIDENAPLLKTHP